MSRLARQNSPQVDQSSIDMDECFGTGTAVRQDDDSLDNGGQGTVDVISVSRGRRWDNAELTRSDTDLVGSGRRLTVMARSGNEAQEHEDEDELDDQEFDQVGMGEDLPASAMSPGMKVAVIAVVGGLLFALSRR